MPQFKNTDEMLAYATSEILDIKRLIEEIDAVAMWHDFWCQVAIAALLTHMKCLYELHFPKQGTGYFEFWLKTVDV